MLLSRMASADAHAAIEKARTFAYLLRSRAEVESARKLHATLLKDEPRQRGNTQAPTPSDRQCWTMNVAKALYQVAGGRLGMEIILARLTRRKKSTEASWEQIASDFGTTTDVARNIFDETVPLWLMLLGMKNLDLEYRQPAKFDESAPVRCAVIEQSKGESECPTGSVAA
jgi:hypothetical protein